MNKLQELKQIEKLINVKLKSYDDALKNKDYEGATKELNLVIDQLDKLDKNEIKLTTEKILN